jgi:acid stress-induced BolA-like protein IbaG/YrbA
MNHFEDISNLIKETLNDAEVHILDPRNDGVHLEAIVICRDFVGKGLVQQHQLVMQGLKERFATDLHALGLKTFTPEQWENKKHEYQIGV